MRLLINPEGGMAGDMFAAALVSAGADFDKMKRAMEAAGRKLGNARIEINQTDDGSTQLAIRLESERHHLGANEGRAMLTELFEEFGIQEEYRNFGNGILEILIKAEQEAHRRFNIVIEGDGHHHHQHPHEHDNGLGHHHGHSHSHNHDHDNHHHHHEEAYLHEAQDIVIDIMGAVVGMQELNIEPKAVLLKPVSVGGGHVHCSHGTLSIPAPATTVIMEHHGIRWEKGPIEKELFTPTGAAIVAGLKGRFDESVDLVSLGIVKTGQARGTKILEIPPLKIYVLND